MRTASGRARIPVVTHAPLAALAALVILAAGCGSDASSTGASTDSTAASTAASTTAVAAADVTTTAVATSVVETSVVATDPTVTVATVAPETTAGANEVAISVTVGVDSGPDRIESIPLGATVTLTIVNPDSDDEFHAHGYELGDGMEIPAGQPASFTFAADEPGEFEVESHATDEVLVVLNVVG